MLSEQQEKTIRDYAEAGDSEFAEDEVKLSSLEATLQVLMTDAENSKENVKYDLRLDYFQALSILTDDEKTAMEEELFSGSQAYFPLTNSKCRSFQAWVENVLFGSGKQIWSIQPTPRPEIPDEWEDAIEEEITAQQFEGMVNGQPMDRDELTDEMKRANAIVREIIAEDAERSARLAEEEIRDILIEGDFEKALKNSLYNFCRTKNMFLKGPIPVVEDKIEWKHNGEKPEAVFKKKLKLKFKSVSPWDIYPSPQATDIQDGYLFERVRVTQEWLQTLKHSKYALPEVINEVAASARYDGYREIYRTEETTQRILEDRYITGETEDPGMIEGFEFWGKVSRDCVYGTLGEDRMPVEFMDDEILNIMAIIVRQRVVFCKVFPSWHKRPYYSSSFMSKENSFWGYSLCEVLRPYQRTYNVTMRLAMNNLALSSGPQIIIPNTERVIGSSIDTITAYKIWAFTNNSSDANGKLDGNDPIQFEKIPNEVQNLLGFAQYIQQQADQMVGVPSYPMTELSGAARGTASGMSIAFGQAGRDVRSVLRNLELDVIKPAIESIYRLLMLYSPELDLKGDVRCDVVTKDDEQTKEMTLARQLEFATMTVNPMDQQLMGAEARAVLLRNIAENLGLKDVLKFIPETSELLRAKMAENRKDMEAGAIASMQGNPPESPSNLTPGGAQAGGALFNEFKG